MRAKPKFYLLSGIQIVLIVLHKVLDSGEAIVDFSGQWHYWLTMSFFVYYAFFILTLRCKSCEAAVIYKQAPPWYWRLPSDKCSECDAEI